MGMGMRFERGSDSRARARALVFRATERASERAGILDLRRVNESLAASVRLFGFLTVVSRGYVSEHVLRLFHHNKHQEEEIATSISTSHLSQEHQRASSGQRKGARLSLYHRTLHHSRVCRERKRPEGQERRADLFFHSQDIST